VRGKDIHLEAPHGVNPSGSHFAAWKYQRVNSSVINDAHLKIAIGRGD